MTEIRSDICRRMDSAKLWMQANDETAITGSAQDEEKDSDDTTLTACPLKDPQNGKRMPSMTFDKRQKNPPSQRVHSKDNGDINSDKPPMSRRPPRPNVDIVLSLKDPVYKTVLTKFYQLLGKKKNEDNEDARVRELAIKALLILKSSDKNEEKCVGVATRPVRARFFKPSSRNAKNAKFVEVDEKAALKSEDFVLQVSSLYCFYST